MLNRVVLVGRMVRDPELRRTGTGAAVTSFTLAMNRNFSNQQGERQADFIPCVVWNKIAENTARYCSKGSLVGVEGRMQSRTYENQDGRKVNVIEVICDSVQFLETRSSNEQRTTQPVQTDDFSNPFQDMKNDDIQKEFDSSNNAFDIMDDDIQF
jgi:single stranded DNA-binding protein (ssb)